MSNQKRLSQVSLAAVALLAAALPALAQTESNNRHNAVDQARSAQIATLRNDRTVRKAETKTTPENVTAKSVNASRDRLSAAIADATSSTSAFTSTATFTESDWQKTQRLSKDFDSASSKSITFVPSRGQKLPE